ncbi:MIT domain-containing protein 1-like [Argonauta hians]
MEDAAIEILKRAIHLDHSNRLNEAITCYDQGVGLLLKCIKEPQYKDKRDKYREKIEEYLLRAEKLKDQVLRSKEALKNQVIHIAENSTGHGYATVFGPFLDPSLTEVQVDDPYIRSSHQLINFLRFCELLKNSEANVNQITLNTSCDSMKQKATQQREALSLMQRNFEEEGIELEINYRTTLHDREIRFNNGYVVKIGRGLDYFKNVPHFTLGAYEYNLRPCLETTINIFHTSQMKTGKP